MRRDWQPPSDSPKLGHGLRFLDDLTAETAQFIQAGGVRHSVGPGGATFEFPPAPATLSLLIGDSLQNLRSALDHDVYRISA